MELIYLRPLSDTFVLFWLVLSGKTASSTLSDVSAVASSRNRDVLGGGALCILDGGSAALYTKQENELITMNCDIDGDMENQVEVEEKTRLINQVLELQHTLEDLSARVDAVKEENLKLKSENQVLGQYIENLMSASSVFQTTDTKSKRK
ncbi:short coiled-coil protein A isoform X1 [Maylandia zebra]|uniref:short coiled-coil protein A isoform X1 n=1 Tax=Maylandia zebra TaxID=106582 RepID=UPI00403CB8B2